ncbi:MAG: 5-methyltetrahydropteroyltriglutamate--homocysteine S-methyltransferase [Hyphomicrobiales bacterium]
MPSSNPPFRADHVGSLLRTAILKDARERRARQEISAQELSEIEDREIERIIGKQEEIGLRLATDGEFRRAVWSTDFLQHLDGWEGYVADHGVQFNGMESTRKAARVVGKIGFSGHPMIEHFRFLKAHTRVLPKMTIPSPAIAHFRGDRAAIHKVYPDIEAYFADCAEAWRKAIRAFYDAGCRYLQFDDTAWAHLCSTAQRELTRGLGDDPEKLPGIYARMINHAIKDRPSDLVITTHVCRGNFRSTFVSEGGYEPVAEVLLRDLQYDGYFLEYDSDRAGDFKPLRFLPKGKKRVVLGLITSKHGALESKDEIKLRLDEATKYVDLDQLCLSPQCGFASTEEGNVLAEEEQWAKLRLCVEIAQEVWGSA